jgi:hypothetical protein
MDRYTDDTYMDALKTSVLVIISRNMYPIMIVKGLYLVCDIAWSE